MTPQIGYLDDIQSVQQLYSVSQRPIFSPAQADLIQAVSDQCGITIAIGYDHYIGFRMQSVQTYNGKISHRIWKVLSLARKTCRRGLTPYSRSIQYIPSLHVG